MKSETEIREKAGFSYLLFACCFFITAYAYAQADTTKQKDLIDVLQKTFKKHSAFLSDTSNKKTGHLYLSTVPALGYTLHTRAVATISFNGAFYTGEGENANLSVVTMDPEITQNRQIVVPIHSNIWAAGNKYNFLGDLICYFKYPQYTYGLGGHSSLNNADLLDYSYILIRQTALKQFAPDFFAGIGYGLDYHFNITEEGTADGRITDYQKYGSSKKSVSSGVTLNILYDNRRNVINPPKGYYANIVYRPNFTFLGSNQNWQSLLLDFRKYFKLSGSSKNVLAFWSYNWITLSGNPPYLDLPSTGWDNYANMGRGYIQSRLRGKNLLYLESEYRFKITHSGLFGGVVFANAQTVSEWPSNKFETILPGVGTGIRIKVNKHSSTNIAVDYGWGLSGSHGIFVNLGEVF